MLADGPAPGAGRRRPADRHGRALRLAGLRLARAGLGRSASTTAPTSSAWASCSTRWSPASARSAGTHPLEVLHAVIHAGPVPCRATTRACPPRCRRILERALAKDPARPVPDDGRPARRAQGPASAGCRPRRPAGAGGAAASVRPAARRGPGPRWARASDASSGAAGEEPADAEGADARCGLRPRAGGPARPASWGTRDQAHDRRPAVPEPRRRSRRPTSTSSRWRTALITELAHVRSLVVRPSSYIARLRRPERRPAAGGRGARGAGGAGGQLLQGPRPLAGDRAARRHRPAARSSGATRSTSPAAGPHHRAGHARRARGGRPPPDPDAGGAGEDRAAAHAQRAAPTSSTCAGATCSSATCCARWTTKTWSARSACSTRRSGSTPTSRAAHAALGRCYVQHAQGYGGDEYYRWPSARCGGRWSSTPRTVEARLQMRLRGPPPRQQGAGQGHHRRPAAGGGRTIPPSSSWRPCSTGWTASTSRPSPNTTTCWS